MSLAQLGILHRIVSKIYSLNILVSSQTSLDEISMFAINIMTDFSPACLPGHSYTQDSVVIIFILTTSRAPAVGQVA